MQISRHTHYIDSPDGAVRINVEFNPPVEAEMPYGSIQAVYGEAIHQAKRNDLEPCAPVVNSAGILIVDGVFEEGDIVSIALRPECVLSNISLDGKHQIEVLVDDQGLVCWIRIGKDGAFGFKAKVVKDTSGVISKMRSNLDDIPLREYLIDQAKVKFQPDPLREEEYPPYMDAELAARYLGISIRTFYDIPREELPQAPHGRYRKTDLDKYMEDNRLHKKRPRKNA